MKSRKIILISYSLLSFFFISCGNKETISNSEKKEYLKIADLFKIFAKQGLVLNIYRENFLDVGNLYGKYVMLFSDTLNSVYEIENTKDIKNNDGLRVKIGKAKVEDLGVILDFMNNKNIYSIILANEDVVFSFKDCCPRIRIAVTDNPDKFFLKEYSENYVALKEAGRHKNSTRWAKEIDRKVILFKIDDQF